MTPSLRKKPGNKILDVSSSSESSNDSDEYMPYKRARLRTSKSMQNKLNQLCDTEDNSNNAVVSIAEKNNSKSHLNISKIKRKNKTNHTKLINDSDSNSKGSIKSTNYDADKNSSSCPATLIQNQRKFPNLSNNNKGKSKVEVTKPNEKDKDECNDSSSSVTSIFTKESKQRNTKKCDGTIQDFKPYITKIINKLDYKFLYFKEQIKQLEPKYVKDDMMTLGDAGNVMFIFNCIISKLKEELSEEQQDLTRSYIEWSRKHKCNHDISNLQNKQCASNTVNNKNLQVHNNVSQTSSDNDNEMSFANVYKNKQLLKVTEKLHNSIQEKDRENSKIDKTHYQSVKNKEDELETVDTFINVHQNENNNVTLKNNKERSPSLVNFREFELTEKFVRNYIGNKEIDKETNPANFNTLSPSSKDTQGLLSAEENAMINEPVEEETQMIDCDSDVSSTCSTVALYSSRCINMQHSHECENEKCGEQLESFASENAISLKQVENVFQAPRLYRCDSDDTIIIPSSQKLNFNIHCSNNGKNFEGTTRMLSEFSVNENLIPHKGSNFIFPNISTEKRFTSNCNVSQVSFFFDKASDNEKENNSEIDKLHMDCQVVVEKCKL